MGNQSQQQQSSSAVFYDPEKGQYYTLQAPQSNDPASNIMFKSPILGMIGGLTGGNLGNEYRNYLGSSLTGTANRFAPQTVAPNYPEMSQLFPALDIGLAQNLNNSLLGTTDNTQSSGAGRFLAPSTSSKGK